MPVRYQIAGRTAADISASVESGVRDGALPAGTALPPVRALAEELGVAPATVAAAYRTLRQRGLVETAGRNGTRVRSRPPLLSQRHGIRLVPPPGTVDLMTGEPDRSLLPNLTASLRRISVEPIRYADAGAWPELVTMGRQRLVADGVPDAPVTVTSGALDAIERLLATHLRPGDRVGVEDPGWANLIDLVAALGLTAVPMPVDEEGPTVAGLRHALDSGVGAIVVTSRAQNPTGAAVTPDRAAALRPLLARHPAVLSIEDDHAAELATVPLAPLAGAGASWAFIRSLSKPYGPDLRVAVVAGDDASIARVAGRLRLGAGWVSTVLQRIVVDLWQDRAVADLVARARLDYAARREAVLSALVARGVRATGRTGINIWVPVPDEALALAVLRDRGWAAAPGSLYRLSSAPGLRLTISALSLSDVDSLAGALAEAAGLVHPSAGTSR